MSENKKIYPESSGWSSPKWQARREAKLAAAEAYRAAKPERLRIQRAARERAKADKLQAQIDAGGKICKKCGEFRKLEDFSKDSGKLGGRRYTCKHCSSAYYYEERQHLSKEYNKKYREQNLEKIEARRKEYNKRPEVIRRTKERWLKYKADPVRQQKRKEYYEKYKADPVRQQKRKEARARSYESFRRDKLYQKRYGITVEEYELMLEEQNHACAICGTTDSGRRRFCIDHNHHTQKVRGLLCDRCNMFVGHAKESVTLMKSFVPYLTKPPRIPARPRIKRNTPIRSKARVLTENAAATKLLGEPALRCIDCEQVLPIESFGKTKGNSTGRKPYCNICEACRRHNITPKEYSIMLEEQGQTCATCSEGFERTARKGKKRSDSQTTRRIDHCHQTGSVRGILCHHCNCALGYVKDSLAKIHAAINYLNDHAET